MIFGNKKKIILWIFLFSYLLILSACMKISESSNFIDLSSTVDFDFKIYYNEIDVLSNYTTIYFEYDGKKTEVFEHIKLSENGLPVVIKEDIDFDGKYELIIYLQAKTNVEYEEKIYFLNYETGKEITIDEINNNLSENEKLVIKKELINNMLENGNMYAAFLLREHNVNETNIKENKSFRIVNDIKKDDELDIIIYNDSVIRNVNYTNDIRKEYIINNIITEILMATKSKQSLFVNTKESYVIDYKDINNDSLNDLIIVCNTADNKYENDDIYIMDGLTNEFQNVEYNNKIHETEENYQPLVILNRNNNIIDGKYIALGVNDNKIVYINDFYKPRKSLSSPFVIDLSNSSHFDFKIYCNELDELGNYNEVYFEYNGIKTEVFNNMKLCKDGFPVAILEDIDNDGNKEITLYLQEKTDIRSSGLNKDILKVNYEEKIYFLDYENGKELSLNQINQNLSKYEKLEIKKVFERSAFENGQIFLAFLKRKEEINEINLDDNKAFSLVEDISKEDKNIIVEIYEDGIIKKINYINDKNLSSALYNARKDFINKNITIELINITKNKKDMLINTKGSYIIEYKDINEDNVEDIILICDIKENKILKDNVYSINGLNFEKLYIEIIDMYKTPEDYPLNLIYLNPRSESNERKILALKNNEIFYLDDNLYGRAECVVKDFNDDGENEIALRNELISTFGRERFVYIYNEKNFEKISFSTNSVYDIIDSIIEYNIEYIENEQACFVTIKDKNNDDKLVIKISSDTVKPNFKFVYPDFLNSDIVNNSIIEIPNLCLTNAEKPARFVTLLDFEVIYEMQNNEFVIKDINHTFNLDFTFIYDSDKYKFEIIENSIKDLK